MDKAPKLRLGISSCLLGEEVRFDGGHKRDRFLSDTLKDFVQWFPLCPEVEIGLGTPRESLRLIGAVEAPQLYAPRSGSDHTEAMQTWAATQWEQIEALDLDGYVLKKDSPSCGLFRVRVYPGEKRPPHRQGRGIFAAVLADRFPLLPLEEEGRLHDLPLRENFIERLFAYSRWKTMLAHTPTPAGLVAFHASHKFTLMAHSPSRQKELGRWVAQAGSLPWEAVTLNYGARFMAALAELATPKKHANVLQHIMGFLKDHIDNEDKQELVETIDRYRTGFVPLIVPITLLKHHLRRNPVEDWILDQTYLNPYPQELMLRNHV